MMELITRGKRLDNGEWIEGNYNYIRKITGVNGNVVEYKHVILPFELYEREDMMKSFVDQKTLGIYTGEDDDNGAQIFEGDILRLFTSGEPEPSVISVEWFCGAFYAVYEDGTSELLNTVSNNEYCHFTVIGNIHDNPQLLAVVGESDPDLDHSGLNTGDLDC